MIIEIERKIDVGEPLDVNEGLFLFREEVDLHRLGRLADRVKRRISGDHVFYNINAHLNPTNVCKYRCPLCAFSCSEGDEKAYSLSREQILQEAKNAVDAGCTELHWVGGIPAHLSYSWYRDTLAEIHARFPRLLLKAWTAVEIRHFADSSGKTVEEILTELRAAGLSALPGGGAEIFDSDLRRKIAPDKPSAEQWIDVHRTAHRLGIPTNATMLFGLFDSAQHRIEHLFQLRQLQEESIAANRPARFETFVPLVFHPEGTAFADRKMIPPHEILRTIAVARLFLTGFPHLKAYWITLGLELAQIALGYGADDFDGTVHRERIHHEAGSKTPEGLTENRIRELIAETGRVPMRRR